MNTCTTGTTWHAMKQVGNIPQSQSVVVKRLASKNTSETTSARLEGCTTWNFRCGGTENAKSSPKKTTSAGMTHENSTRPQELMYLTHLKQSAHIAPQIFDGSRGRCQCSNGSFQASLVTGRQKQTTILKSGRVACSTKVKLCGRKPGHTYRTTPSINISRTIVQKLHVHGRETSKHYIFPSHMWHTSPGTSCG